MEIDTSTDTQWKVLSQVEDPAFEVKGTLYFLEADYLYRYKDERGNWISKFVTATDLAAAFSQKEQDTGWLTAGIVRSGSNAKGDWFVYSAPAQKVEILIAADEKITIPIPRTVLMGIGSTYYLWAMKSKYFVPDDPVYTAPFPNIYPEGRICWGQNAPGPAAPATARKTWSLFFESPFNGDLATGKSEEYKNDVRLLLRSLDGNNIKAFPAADLVRVGRKVGTQIESILGGGHVG